MARLAFCSSNLKNDSVFGGSRPGFWPSRWCQCGRCSLCVYGVRRLDRLTIWPSMLRDERADDAAGLFRRAVEHFVVARYAGLFLLHLPWLQQPFALRHSLAVGHWIDPGSNRFSTILSCVLAAYAVAGFLWARRLFLGAQEVAWTGGQISLTTVRGVSLRWLAFEFKGRQNRWMALVKKELQLQEATMVLVPLLALLYLAALAIHHFAPQWLRERAEFRSHSRHLAGGGAVGDRMRGGGGGAPPQHLGKPSLPADQQAQSVCGEACGRDGFGNRVGRSHSLGSVGHGRHAGQ